MSAESFILDASVAAKWVLAGSDEPLREEAMLLLDGFQTGRVGLLVPDLFWIEIGSILWKGRGKIVSQKTLLSMEARS